MIQLFKSFWGMEGDWEHIFSRIAAAGYAGIECPPPGAQDASEFKELLARYDLAYVAMLFTDGRSPREHADAYSESLAYAAQFRPVSVTAHSSRDRYSWDGQCEFYAEAVRIERELGVSVGHETHRGRALFTPWTTAELLRNFPDLRLTADFSHWTCVTESLLEEHTDALDLAIARTIHIHARVGYAQGPQVPHPGAPEYARELDAHTRWWKRIAEIRAAAGLVTTITPEFGPAESGYMPRLPFTNVPVADLWSVCLWMKEHLEHKI